MRITRLQLRNLISEKIDQSQDQTSDLDIGSNIHMGNFSEIRSDYSGAKTFIPETPYYIIPEYMASEDSHVTDPKDPYVYVYDSEKDSFKIVGSPLHPKLGLKSLGADFKKGDIAYNILVKRLGKVNEVSNTNKDFINRLIKEELSSMINEDRNRDTIIEKSQILNELELSKDFINDEILDSIIDIGEPFIETFKNDPKSAGKLAGRAIAKVATVATPPLAILAGAAEMLTPSSLGKGTRYDDSFMSYQYTPNK